MKPFIQPHNGFRVDYTKWMQGYRVAVDGNKTWWIKSGESGNTETISGDTLNLFLPMQYLSLAGEMKKVTDDSLQRATCIFREAVPATSDRC